MSAAAALMISDQDFERLSLLVHHALDEELARAKVVAQRDIPADLVTMNSTIRFVDEASGKQSEVTLVYPKDADVTTGKVSVLAPVGMALIGLRVGQSILWPMPTGKRRLKVVDLVYQPEAAGHWHL